MKQRLKWILVGLGFTFALQVIISLAFTGISYSAAASETGLPPDTVFVVAIALFFGAFLVGGFVMGWMSERLRIPDAIAAAAAAFGLGRLVYAMLPSANKAQFLVGYMLEDITRGLMFLALASVAAGVGAYWGWHVKVPQEGTLDRVALLIGLLGAVVGPFVLLAFGGRDSANPNQPNLPWYFLAIVLILVLTIIGVGFFMFTRESRDSEEISISPDARREP